MKNDTFVPPTTPELPAIPDLISQCFLCRFLPKLSKVHCFLAGLAAGFALTFVVALLAFLARH